MTSIKSAVIVVSVGLLIVIVGSGIALNWCLPDLSNLGQFVGGLASAAALAFVAYGLVFQQRESSKTVAQLAQQTGFLRDANEAQLFNMVFDNLIQSADNFQATRNDGGADEQLHGLVALDWLCDRYIRHSSLENLRPLSNRRSAIEAFLRLYVHTLRLAGQLATPEKRSLFANLVVHQFRASVGKLQSIEIDGTNANRIGLPREIFNQHETVMQSLRDVFQ